MIHGGPHGQQGPAFKHKSQVYAAQGWASLMVNYRGIHRLRPEVRRRASFNDQNGGEAKDVLAGLDARAGEVPVDRSRSARHRRRQLRRPADQLDHHADDALQGGDSRRRASATS